MMKPIYFPYTFVPVEIAEAGAACFEQMVVCQPSELQVPEQMRASEKKGLLDIRMPVNEDEDRVLTVVRDYRKWADVHADGDGVHLALHGQQNNQIPFFNESSILKIKEDLQRKTENKEDVQEKSDPFFLARVFLHMAHELDMQHYDIHCDFKRLDKMEHVLMKDLQGEEAVFSGEGTAGEIYTANDPFDFMVPERMEAWSGLMFHQIEPKDMPGLYVTSNRSVFTYITEQFCDGEIVCEIENIPIGDVNGKDAQNWRNSFIKHIQQYTKDPWPLEKGDMVYPQANKGGGKKAALRLYVVPGKMPFEIFSGFYPHVSKRLNKLDEGVGITNTLIGLIENQL